MLVKGIIKCLLCMGLCLPAAALQPNHDDILIQLQQSISSQGPQVLYRLQPSFSLQFDESHLEAFFSLFSAAMIVLSVRSQQRQDFTKFRASENS